MSARDAATLPLGAGGERVLRDLADSNLGDEAWLRAVAEFATLQRHPPGVNRGGARAAVRAMVVFVP